SRRTTTPTPRSSRPTRRRPATVFPRDRVTRGADPFRPREKSSEGPPRAHSGRPRSATADAAALANVVVVLDEPQDVVNVAAVIRAMKNMGLSRLRLVRPADFDAWRIQGIAHRSADVIERTEIHDTLEEAVADA